MRHPAISWVYYECNFVSPQITIKRVNNWNVTKEAFIYNVISKIVKADESRAKKYDQFITRACCKFSNC